MTKPITAGEWFTVCDYQRDFGAGPSAPSLKLTKLQVRGNLTPGATGFGRTLQSDLICTVNPDSPHAQADAGLIIAAPKLLGAAADALAFVRHALEFFNWGQFPNLQDGVEQLLARLEAAVAFGAALPRPTCSNNEGGER